MTVHARTGARAADRQPAGVRVRPSRARCGCVSMDARDHHADGAGADVPGAAPAARSCPGSTSNWTCRTKADARGTRREFSIVSAPGRPAPTVRIAYGSTADQRHPAESTTSGRSASRRARAPVLAVTGIWGDFILPRDRDARCSWWRPGSASRRSSRSCGRLRRAGASATWCWCTSRPRHRNWRSATSSRRPVSRSSSSRGTSRADLPAHWTWARGVRLDAEGSSASCRTSSSRHAYISGPPRLIADLAPALQKAR